MILNNENVIKMNETKNKMIEIIIQKNKIIY